VDDGGTKLDESYLNDHVTMSVAAIQRTVLGYRDNLAIFRNLLYVLLALTQNLIILRLRYAHELQENCSISRSRISSKISSFFAAVLD
jgi:hypothetical protein